MALINPGDTQKFLYTGDVQSIILSSGRYKLEVWGASGGGWGLYKPAYGGYSCGEISFEAQVMIYVVCGGAGSNRPSNDNPHLTQFSTGSHYNGGACYSEYYGSSGGATHIALEDGILSSLSNNRDSVLIVAGGGGSNGYAGSGGVGGGLNGGNTMGGNTTGSNHYATGATQTSGGTLDYTFGYAVGTFGQGAIGYNMGGNGGGGWYGGASTKGGWSPGGGGGSGYIGGVENGITIAGDLSFPSIDGGTEIGHNGNGCAVITLLELYTESHFRVNSNLYKNIDNPMFDFLKLIGE